MKIGILIAGLSPYGAERATVRLAEELKNHGADVKIFLTDADNKMQIDVPVIPLINKANLSLLKKFFYVPLQYLRMKKRLKQERLDVLISSMERANLLNLILPKEHLKILMVRTFLSQGLAVNGFARRLATKLVYRYFLHRADMVGYVSQAAADDFRRMFPISPDKQFVFQNPLDFDGMRAKASQPVEPEYQTYFHANTILHVGRFTPDKGQWYLIRALPKILEAIPEAELVLLGDGPMQESTMQMVQTLGLSRKVHFLGFQSNPLKYTSRSAILACSSTYEGLPNALLEAMVCKIPIVSADCKSGPRELLAPRTDHNKVAKDIEYAEYGVLTPPFDGQMKRPDEPLTRSEELFAEATIQLLRDRNLQEQYRQNSTQRIDVFRPETVVKNWMEKIDSLLVKKQETKEDCVSPGN